MDFFLRRLLHAVLRFQERGVASVRGWLVPSDGRPSDFRGGKGYACVPVLLGHLGGSGVYSAAGRVLALLSYLEVSKMHGEWPEKGSIPCNSASWCFKNAWGMARKGKNPMQTSFPVLQKCMGDRPKREEPHANQLPGALKMHGEWPEKGRTPCKPASWCFKNAWGMARKGQYPMQFRDVDKLFATAFAEHSMKNKGRFE
ncbi:MAG: hypothetical protein IKQ96_04505 [Lachnospiraceae bacterium]|nr:hypothetical protein [Lachnospiraceae bacterium]